MSDLKNNIITQQQGADADKILALYSENPTEASYTMHMWLENCPNVDMALSYFYQYGRTVPNIYDNNTINNTLKEIYSNTDNSIKEKLDKCNGVKDLNAYSFDFLIRKLPSLIEDGHLNANLSLDIVQENNFLTVIFSELYKHHQMIINALDGTFSLRVKTEGNGNDDVRKELEEEKQHAIESYKSSFSSRIEKISHIFSTSDSNFIYNALHKIAKGEEPLSSQIHSEHINPGIGQEDFSKNNIDEVLKIHFSELKSYFDEINKSSSHNNEDNKSNSKMTISVETEHKINTIYSILTKKASHTENSNADKDVDSIDIETMDEMDESEDTPLTLNDFIEYMESVVSNNTLDTTSDQKMVSKDDSNILDAIKKLHIAVIENEGKTDQGETTEATRDITDVSPSNKELMNAIENISQKETKATVPDSKLLAISEEKLTALFEGIDSMKKSLDSLIVTIDEEVKISKKLRKRIDIKDIDPDERPSVKETM